MNVYIIKCSLYKTNLKKYEYIKNNNNEKFIIKTNEEFRELLFNDNFAIKLIDDNAVIINDEGKSLIHYICEYANNNVIEYFYLKNSYKNELDMYKFTPLNLLLGNADKHYNTIISIISSKNFYINSEDINGRRPIDYLVTIIDNFNNNDIKKFLLLLKLFIKHGANYHDRSLNYINYINNLILIYN